LASEDLELPGVELEVVPVGLGSANEERILSGSGPSASLLPFTDLQNRYFPGSVDFSTRTVQVETLDSWVERREAPRPDVIKIDVQGEELSVLGGAGKTLSHCRWLIVEMSTVVLYDGQGLSGSVLSHLEASGWRFVDFGYQWRSSDQRLLQFDAILTRDDSN
jgi:FkbM family methyltransferase